MRSQIHGTRVRSVVALSAAIALLGSACSSGVSQEELDDVAELLSTAETELAGLSEQLDTAERDLGEKSSEIDHLTSRVEGLASEANASRDLVTRLQADIDELRTIGVLTKADGATLRAVQAAGNVRCGIHGSFAGFSVIDEFGAAAGFDVEFCRAIAAAALGDADAVVYVPLGSQERFPALQSGLIDVLVRNTTHTLFRSADLRLDFGPTIFHDGQQFMGLASTYGAQGVEGLDDARLCVAPGSLPEERALTFAAGSNLTLDPVAVDNLFEAVLRLGTGECDVVTGDGSALAATATRAIEEGQFGTGDVTIFPATPFGWEPLAPVVLQGDTRWADVVDWAVYATIFAEAHGLTTTNVDSRPWNEETMRFFGESAESATLLGLAPDAFYQVVKQVGSYREIYERHLVPIGLERNGSLNELWTDGGLLHAPRV